MSQNNTVESAAPAHAGLLRAGGVAALLVALLTVIEMTLFIIYPPPDTVSAWFELFQSSPLLGLISFWGLEIPMYAMFVLVFLALYAVLARVSRSGMAFALTLSLLGTGIFFATNNPFSMLTLSRKFAAAATDLQRSALLAAGEAILAITNQRAVGGFNIALFLVSIAGVIVAVIMLRAPSFSRLTSYVGILAFGFSLADYLRQAMTSSMLFTLFLVIPGALLLVAWFTLVGLRLLELGRRGVSEARPVPAGGQGS